VGKAAVMVPVMGKAKVRRVPAKVEIMAVATAMEAVIQVEITAVVTVAMAAVIRLLQLRLRFPLLCRLQFQRQ
jgi:hypothetical protein